jgi:uncharacterized protein
MIRSRYTLLYDNFPQEGKHLFFSTRTQATVVIDSELKALLESLPRDSLSESSRDVLSQLTRMGFLVSDEKEDRRIIEGWFQELKSDTSQVAATILTTYACNFACPYCVEGEVIAPVHMNDATAEAAVSYTACRVMELGSEELFVSFYGGEPLLNLRALRIVGSGLRDFAAENGVRFAFGMTTNGSLLRPEVVNELKDLGLKGIKVTLDGTREFHDRKRPFRNGKGTFDVIIENILYASTVIDVDVGGNFDDDNYESFPGLLDYLIEKGLHQRLRAVRFKPISQTLVDRAKIRHNGELGCVYSDPRVAGRMAELRQATMDRGLPVEEGIGVNLCSMVMGSSQFTVDPEGLLYKCPALVGYPEFQVGTIWEGEKRKLVREDLWKRCIGCAYLPLCGEGCLYGSYLRYGDLERLNCQKEYVEYLVEKNLKADYLQRRSESR